MTGNKFGGERLEAKSLLSKNNLLEHLARYHQVLPNQTGLVLDIGCGAGHGSSLLAQKFAQVIGADVSPVAIEYAQANYGAGNIDFRVVNGAQMPFVDNYFDTVVAFEVFEHIADWRSFLQEIRRVAKPEAKIYISTPNKDLYSPGTARPINPHHFFEMTETEFKQALGDYFTIEKFYGQRTPIYNDHWIWRLVNPLLFSLKSIITYKLNNTLKLKIINWIKPELALTDIVFLSDDVSIKQSRFFMAITVNNKK